MSPYGFFEKLEKIHWNKDEAVKVLNIISKANTSIEIWHYDNIEYTNFYQISFQKMLKRVEHESAPGMKICFDW